MSPAEQSAEFQKFAQEQIDAGELDPIAADRALDALVRQGGKVAGDSKEPPAGPITPARGKRKNPSSG